MYVTSTERMSEMPNTVLSEIFDYLEVDDYTIENLSLKNTGNNKNNVNQEAYDYLNQYFESHNQKLYELLGTDFNW